MKKPSSVTDKKANRKEMDMSIDIISSCSYKGQAMKVIVLNATPRKAGNTSQLLKSAAKGAKEAGAEVEFIHLYDLNFTGVSRLYAL